MVYKCDTDIQSWCFLGQRHGPPRAVAREAPRLCGRSSHWPPSPLPWPVLAYVCLALVPCVQHIYYLKRKWCSFLLFPGQRVCYINFKLKFHLHAYIYPIKSELCCLYLHFPGYWLENKHLSQSNSSLSRELRGI